MPYLERHATEEAKEVRIDTQIQVQLSGIEQQIGEIERCSIILLEKLTPILVPFQPGVAEGKVAPELDVPLANQLRIFKERLVAISDGIKDASSRCEL